MKTITEFSGFTLKEAVAKKAALITEGKTEEEALAAIHEQLKLDETKTPFYKNAIDMTNSRLDRVKRVVVALRSTETEKVPEAFSEREGHFYLVEFFPDGNSRAPARGNDRDDFGGGRGRNDRGGGRGNDRGNSRGPGGGAGGGRGNDRGNSGGPGRVDGDRPRSNFDRPAFGAPRNDSAPRPTGTFAAKRPDDPGNTPARAARPPRERGPRNPAAGGEAGQNAGGANRAPRAPRPPRDPNRAPRGPKGAGELRLVLKGQSATTLAGSGVAEAPAALASAPESAPSENSAN